MNLIEQCINVVSNLDRSIAVGCKIIKFIGQVRLTREAGHLQRIISFALMPGCSGRTCTNETIKEICRNYEQSWSTPVDNKIVRFKFQISNKLKRRILGVDQRRYASLKLLLSDIMKQIK